MRIADSADPHSWPEAHDRRNPYTRAELAQKVVGLLGHGPVTPDDLASRLDAHADAIRRVLRRLALRGLVYNVARDCWNARAVLRWPAPLVTDGT